MIRLLSKWAAKQIKNGVRPATTLPYSFPALTAEQATLLVNRPYSIKLDKRLGNPVPESLASGWKSEYLMLNGEWIAGADLDFLKNSFYSLPFSQSIKRVGLMCLEPNGWITVHSDLPVCQQIAIPLVQDDGFHFAWEDWGEEHLLTYSVNIIDIGRRHTVWNTGDRRIYLNCLVDTWDTGESLNQYLYN